MIFDGGLFIAFNALAFAFMFFQIRNFSFLFIIPLILFSTLALLLFAGYEVAFTEVSYVDDGVTTITSNSTKYIIGNGDNQEALGSQWMGFIYFGLSIGSVALFFNDMWKGGK